MTLIVFVGCDEGFCICQKTVKQLQFFITHAFINTDLLNKEYKSVSSMFNQFINADEKHFEHKN